MNVNLTHLNLILTTPNCMNFAIERWLRVVVSMSLATFFHHDYCLMWNNKLDFQDCNQ